MKKKKRFYFFNIIKIIWMICKINANPCMSPTSYKQPRTAILQEKNKKNKITLRCCYYYTLYKYRRVIDSVITNSSASWWPTSSRTSPVFYTSSIPAKRPSRVYTSVHHLCVYYSFRVLDINMYASNNISERPAMFRMRILADKIEKKKNWKITWRTTFMRHAIFFAQHYNSPQ